MSTQRPVALVTGASSGIGRQTALALAGAGFAVVGTGRDTSRVAPLHGVSLLDLDVTDDASVSTLVGQVIARYGQIDVLVNNAGTGLMGAAEENSLAQARDVFDVNVYGVMRMVKAVLPHMRDRGRGRIITLSSVVGFLPSPYMAVYSASKHAIEGYSESLDHEIRQYGVRALLVQPAYTSTGFEANSPQPDTPLAAYEQQRRAFGRLLETAVRDGDDPAAVAEVVVTAATAPKPKLRYTAGPLAGRARALRRFAPAGIFDKQIRKLNRLPD
ncbi:oxidoreductase [Streptomyces sp. V2]|uniref:oxidoreductase n=1 Tax=Streptomyces TaxID=1883 RepID=UPI0006EB391C|nr:MULTISPECIES: oxidoreductase [Streptomyces]PWG14251.1 oxidoreductase [Streptomyces sp. V2]